ncbi:hypothetical protein BDR22DRAFT_885804 [Usnea florida]
MHSSTITAFLLPLLLPSVLAGPTRVHNNEARSAIGPTPAEQSNIRAWNDPVPPATPASTAGISNEQLVVEEGMASEATAIAEGKDPDLCYGSCKRSLKGRREDPDSRREMMEDTGVSP